jgi:hypothetical protein
MSASAAHSGTRSTSACAAQPVPSAKSSCHRSQAKLRRHPCEGCTPRLSSTYPRHKRFSLVQLKYQTSNYRPIGRTQVYSAYLPQHLPGRLFNHLHDGGRQGAQRGLPVGSQSAVEREAARRGHTDVSITLYFGSKRKADLDNFNKLSLDALTGVAYSDDSQISTLTIARGYDKVRPRIEIEIK